ncbi:MAG: hypothetical protein M1839_004794 [Geoglossum umbratile]|nr:MAG: hypothetical protein M1839_004794 [Geoglossum umbratile]
MALTLFTPSLASLLLYLPALALVWAAGVVVYRYYFHPLAHIPGPKIAAVTYLYSFYFNALIGNGGQLYRQVEELHRKYGPVVRITPDEVHLSDPENYERIYHVGTKYWKDPGFYWAFGLGTSAFAAISNETHRVRRAALNPHFSRKTVLTLEDVVHSKAQRFCNRVADALQAGSPADLHHGYRAVSVDVITDYAFDDCYNLLDRPGFGRDYFDMMVSLSRRSPYMRQFPFLRSASKNAPRWLIKWLGGPVANLEFRKRVVAIKAIVDASGGKPPSRKTIFHQLLDPELMEGRVAPIAELVDEAYVIVGAASDTTGNALTIATYHTLSNKEILSKLTTELNDAFPDPSVKPDFITLEKLPYLTGVIKESLRLSYGVLSRLPRVTPPPGATFNGYKIPQGSIVGMSAWTVHHNEDAFPVPEKFDPSRWTQPGAAKRLDKYLVSFSKGSRSCIGMKYVLVFWNCPRKLLLMPN